jgi:hypothetical protein
MSENTITDTPVPPEKKNNTGKIILIVAIVLVVCCICAVLIAGIIYLVTQGMGPVKVAILNYDTDSDISYWSGGVGNDYDLFKEILVTDPDQRFEVSIITEYDLASLGDYQRLVLPDNAIPDGYLSDVSAWFKSGGRSIIAIDSAITYVSYAGWMWEDSAYTNGEDDYWSYDSLFDDLLLVEGPLTRDFFTTMVLSNQTGDSQMFRSRLPADAVILAQSSTDSSNIYAACRKVPGGGTVFVLGPFDSPESDVYDLVRAAIYARDCK